LAAVPALLIVAFRAGDHGPSWLGPCLGAPFLVPALVGADDTAVLVPAVASAALAPAAAGFGATRRARRDDEARRASDDALADSVVRHTARGERARISRELHDVVAHHISMISVQAETARLTTPDLPEDGARRLSEIGDTARTALVEMRRLLGVLREDTAADAPARQPQPGLRELNELLDTARTASAASTRLILRGAPYPLDQGVELAAYRIVQEALTNARRHAPGAAVDVELDFATDGLHVRVRDNGPGPAPSAPPGGHGLLGMRERAAAVGGELETGAGTLGGFVVTAHLPGSRPSATATGADAAGVVGTAGSRP
ncbi:MAG: sensor histidine kinase, partial [Actinomycetota bacterium]|nr:sensor histidine kinase [Actinomycetota bacterium]